MNHPQITQISQSSQGTKMMRSEQDGSRDPRTYAIIGAAIEVHRQLGCGFLEPVYQEALAMEFDLERLPYNREVELPVFYKGKQLATSYRVDLICYGSLIVELEALAKLSGVEEAQVLNYMKAGGFATGLLLNFGAKTLEHRRIALTQSADRLPAGLHPQITQITPIDTGRRSSGLGQSVKSAKSADRASYQESGCSFESVEGKR